MGKLGEGVYYRRLRTEELLNQNGAKGIRKADIKNKAKLAGSETKKGMGSLFFKVNILKCPSGVYFLVVIVIFRLCILYQCSMLTWSLLVTRLLRVPHSAR